MLEDRGGDPSADARNQAIRKFADGLKEVAAKEGATFVNQFDPYMAIMRREHALVVGASIGGADECLPMPVDPRAVNALKLAPLLDSLNRYELKLTGLPADRYDIMIDGEFVTTLTRQELAKGWNLATTAGPVSRQANEVLALIFKKVPVVQTLWEAEIDERGDKVPGLKKQLEEFETQIKAACLTKPHHFVIKPSGT